MIWRDLPDPTPPEPVDDPSAALRWSAGLSLLTGGVALIAAGAEIWRFILMLQGRTLVLSGSFVRASDVLVAASGSTVVLAAIATVAVAVPALLRTHRAAARRLGRAPSRSKSGILARLLVPVWNVYGAGQIVTEIDRMLGSPAASPIGGTPAAAPHDAGTPETIPAGERVQDRASKITTAWWVGWIVSAGLIVATLARGFGGSLQAIADTVELHIAVDLMAAVVAGLGTAMLLRFARTFTDRSHQYDQWVVQPPAPTRRRS